MHRRRRSATAALVALAAVLAVVLTACGAPTVASPGPMTVSGTVVTDGSPVLGTGLVFFDAAALVTGAVAPASILELDAGVYVGPLTAVDDGQFTIELPDGDELPAAVLAVAATAFYNIDGVPDCDVVADVPTAVISEFAVGLGALPGAYAVSADAGFSVAFVADAIIDFSAPTVEEALGGRTLFGWIYASEDVSLSIEGAGCGAATNVGVAGSVVLSAGWNQVAWEVNGDMTLATLRADDGGTDLVLNVREP